MEFKVKAQEKSMVETYESYTGEDNTVPRKRSYENETESNDKQATRSSDPKRHYVKQPLLKLLVPNYAAGAIIGKGGTNIGDLQNKYGATIRISHNREFYPGTDERIVVLTGEVSQIIDFHEYIIDKVSQDTPDIPGKRYDIRGQQVKIVLPNSTAGIIIGRGGTAIKALQEETKTKIMITGRDESTVAGERVLSVTGNTDQRTEAAKQVIMKIATDPDNMANSHLKYSRGSSGDGQDTYSHINPMDIIHHTPTVMGTMLRNFPHDNFFSAVSFNPLSGLTQNPLTALSQNPLPALPQNPLPALGFSIPSIGNLGTVAQQLAEVTQDTNAQNNIKTTVLIEMEIPDVLVGPFMGVNGNTISEYMKFSGAKLQFAQKSDLTPGKKILTIHGDLNQTQIGYYLVNQKLTQVRNELTPAF